MRSHITALVVVVVALLPSAAAADAIPSTITLSVDRAYSLMPDERDAMLARLIQDIEFFRQRESWRCVGPPKVATSAAGDNKSINFTILIVPDPGNPSPGAADAAAVAQVFVLGKEQSSRAFTVHVGDDHAQAMRDLRDVADRALNDALARTTSPCTPTVKMKGKTRMSLPHMNVVEGTQEGETRLELTTDGSFTAVMPLVEHVSEGIVQSPAGNCRFPAADYQDTADLAGHYDANDGALKFTHMADRGLRGTATLTVTCTVGGHTFSQSAPPTMSPSMGVDVASQYDVRIALQDHARTVIPIPPPAPGVTAEFTIDLTFEGVATVAHLLGRIEFVTSQALRRRGFPAGLP